MNTAQQLYQLQELDIELDSRQQALDQARARLGESRAVRDARSLLEDEQKRLTDLASEQRSLELEIETISTKIKKAQDELYSGRVQNPKELGNLQHEIEVLTPKRSQLEDSAIDIIEQIEQTTSAVGGLKTELARLESEWQSEQQSLTAQVNDLEAEIAGLKKERAVMASQFAPDVLEFYTELKDQKGTAMALVEVGICRGCRLALSNEELQRVRGDDLMQCSSCGRIMCIV